MALTLEQIQAMMPNQGDLLSSLGLTYYGEAEDGSPRYVNSEGSLVSPGQLQEMLGTMGDFTNRSLESQGVLDATAYTQGTDFNRYDSLMGTNYGDASGYLSQLYGGGQQVGDYFVLPENNKQGVRVGTAAETYSPGGFFKEFLGDALKLGGAAYGLNSLSGLIGGLGEAGAGGLADASWGVNPAGAAGGMSQAELAALIESGTSGAAGAGLEAAGLAGNGLSAAQYAALQGGGSLASSAVPNFMDYIKTGSVNGSAPNLAPEIPGLAPAGNGVGLTEAALKGLAPAATSSVAGRIFDGNANASDYMSALGTAGATALGLAGANSQSDALKDVYNQQMNLGAGYRDRLNASYQPGFNLATADPAYQGALDTSAQAISRATSTKANTFDPGAQMEMQKYLTNSTALPALQNYRSQLGTFGQLGTNTAGAAALGGAQSQGGTYNALGYGLGQLTQPDNPFKGLLSQFGKSGFSF